LLTTVLLTISPKPPVLTRQPARPSFLLFPGQTCDSICLFVY
jgi:hypothetical protein